MSATITLGDKSREPNCCIAVKGRAIKGFTPWVITHVMYADCLAHAHDLAIKAGEFEHYGHMSRVYSQKRVMWLDDHRELQVKAHLRAVGMMVKA